MRPRPLGGRFWRVLSPRWAHAPLAGGGAARHGGRYNRPGVSALYLSEQLETAVSEYQQDLGDRPGTFVAYDVEGAAVLDLTDPAVLRGVGASPAELEAPWKRLAFIEGRDPPTWRLADLLARRADGVRVPSLARRGGVNLVLWRWNETGGPTVTARDPRGELP